MAPTCQKLILALVGRLETLSGRKKALSVVVAVLCPSVTVLVVVRRLDHVTVVVVMICVV